MKTTCISSSIAILTLISAQNIARAQLVITDATMADSMVSFTLSGILTGPAPFADKDGFDDIPPSLTFTLNDLPNIGALGSGTTTSTWPTPTSPTSV